MIDETMSCTEAMQELEEKIVHINSTIDDLKKRMELYKYQSQYLFWNAYREDNETELDARKRFFSSLEPINEDMNIIQQTKNLLLMEFKRICDAHNIGYWLDCGTLIGAVRHKGFVTWDDDTAVGIMRKDLRILKNVLKEEKTFIMLDDFHAARTQYCNILRIKFADNCVPMFFDLFVYDFCSKVDDHSWNEYRRVRNEFNKNMLKYIPTPSSDPELGIIEKYKIINEAHIKEINKAFDYYTDILSSTIGLSENDGDAIIWGIDNFSFFHDKKCIYEKREIYPFEHREFCGKVYNIPHMYEEYLYSKYGDIYQLPDDILSHRNIRTSPDIIAACKRLIQKHGIKF